MKIKMIGKKFGRLTVLEELKERTKSREIKYKCLCDCGKYTNVRGSLLRNGEIKSCGCLQRETVTKINTKHGKSHNKLYDTYNNMIQRCNNSNNSQYTNYGGRGIKVCDEWKNNFIAFYSWSMDNGYSDGLTIDRIDNNGNYEPDNCRWVDYKTQNNNERSNVYITYKGMTKTLQQWSEYLNVDYGTIRTRHKKGWSDEECLFGKKQTFNVNKYNYVTNEIMDSYSSIQCASFDNKISYGTIYRQMTKNILEFDSGRGFYFGYSPISRYVIECYDNWTRELLGVYGSMKEASEKTGVSSAQISWQCRKNLPFNKRAMGCTGLWFVKKLYE